MINYKANSSKFTYPSYHDIEADLRDPVSLFSKQSIIILSENVSDIILFSCS